MTADLFRLRRDQLRALALEGSEEERAAVADELLRRLLRREQGGPHVTPKPWKSIGVKDPAAVRRQHGITLSIEPDDELVPDEGSIDDEAA